jgi:hypothetical protein
VDDLRALNYLNDVELKIDAEDPREYSIVFVSVNGFELTAFFSPRETNVLSIVICLFRLSRRTHSFLILH